jgi:hypothetical protein
LIVLKLNQTYIKKNLNYEDFKSVPIFSLALGAAEFLAILQFFTE